jgi:pyridoxal phosphate enzyme (YggS family)
LANIPVLAGAKRVNTVTKLTDNISSLHRQIRSIEQHYERPLGSVRLLAVSKKQTQDKIRLAAVAGIKDFGENYLQEALEKIEVLRDLDLTWHFIGPLQSNKTRSIAQYFDWVQSVDREKIARRLSEQRPADKPALNVCVQVNLSAEASKSGLDLQQTDCLCDIIDNLPNLSLRGLMAIPAPLSDLQAQRRSFRRLADTYRNLQLRYPDMDTLSMGMSNDYESAIAEGSTLIRIGTALFGPRS